MGQEVIAGGLAQAIEQYFVPVPPSEQNSGTAKSTVTPRGPKPITARGTTYLSICRQPSERR